MASIVLRLERWLDHVETAVAVGGLGMMLVLALVQSLMRNLLDSGMPMVDVVLRHLVLLVSFSGAVMAIRDRRHIKIDAALIWVPGSWRRSVGILCNLFATGVCGIFAWAALRFWWEEWQTAPEAERWVAAMALVFPVSFGLMAVHFLVRWLTRCTVFSRSCPR